MHHQFLLQVVSVIIVFSGIDVPAPKSRTVYTVIRLVPNQSLPVILRDVCTIGSPPRLILDLG